MHLQCLSMPPNRQNYDLNVIKVTNRTLPATRKSLVLRLLMLHIKHIHFMLTWHKILHYKGVSVQKIISLWRGDNGSWKG